MDDSAALVQVLFAAAFQGHLEEIKALVSAGADVDTALPGDGGGLTPLLASISTGQLDLIFSKQDPLGG